MKAKRRRHDAAFKARVALEALKGIKTIQQIAKEYEIHPVQVSEWKKRAVEGFEQVFEAGGGSKGDKDCEVEREQLHSKIGKLTVELDFLAKNPNNSASERKVRVGGKDESARKCEKAV
jgi:transposase